MTIVRSINLSGFINTGLDNRIVNYINKSLHEGQIYTLLNINPRNARPYHRHQWINPNLPPEQNIHQGFRHTKSWEKRAKDTLLQSLQVKDQIESIKKAIEQTHASIKTAGSKIKQLQGKINEVSKKLKRNPTDPNLTTQLTHLQNSLVVKQQVDLKELEAQKEELQDIKQKTLELRDWLKEEHSIATQQHNTIRRDLEAYTRQYQDGTQVTQRDLGNFTDRSMASPREQREYEEFKRECARRYQVTTDPNTGQRTGFTTYTGQLITSVDSQHLFKRSKGRGFSLDDVEYILKNPKYVVNGTDTTTGRSAIIYATYTRSVVVLQGGTIKTCININVQPPTSYSRWLIRGWNYKNESITAFKNRWYTQHPEYEEKDRLQDERWIDLWRTRGFDLEAQYAIKDPRGQVIRDNHGQIMWTQHGRALSAFKTFLKDYSRRHPNYDPDLEFQSSFPDEFIRENERQITYTGRNNQDEYRNAYRRRSQSPPIKEPLLQYHRRHFQRLVDQCRQLVQSNP